jgi:cytochrome P450
VGVDKDRVDDLFRWGSDTIAAFGGDPDAVERGFIAMQELFAYLMPKIELRREMLARGEEPPSGILTALVTADYEGSHFTDDEVLMAAQQLLTAGFETTSTSVASAVHLLCTHPDQRRRYEDNPSLIDRLVEETLRFAAPIEGLFRTAKTGVEIAGCPIPEGAKVRLVWASANHDERAFSDPKSFRIDRPLAETRKHLAFGIGPHACAGAALARAELRTAISTMFRRLPGLELDATKPSVRNPILLVNGYRSLPVRWDPARALPRKA